MAVSDIHWHTLLVVVLLLHLQCLHNPFVQACGGNFIGSSGVITSPSYPQSYQNNLTCVYTITQSQGLPIALIFEDFITEEHSSCSWDYVEIRDGNFDTSHLLTPRLCGSVLPPVLCSTQRYMRLLFRTDGSVQYRGFRATYSVCGGNFTESSGIIRSPSYPNNYPNNIDYSYVINQTDGYFIYLNFMDFSLEYSSTCTLDYVEIRNGGTFVSPVLGTRLCGSLLPPVQRTTTNLMWIRFKTNGSGMVKGFQASYTTCGGRFTSQTGVLSSPSYPNSYPGNMDCSYVISQSSGYFVTVTFTSFYLQSSVNCSSDFLEIRNGGSSVSPILGTRLCGSQLPPVQRTTQNLMWIRFKTDNSVTNYGFQASYTTCGGSFTSSTGVLTSPSYPSSYPNNMDCTYVISQPSGYFVTLTFTVFSLQTSANCSSDFLEIRNGGSSVSPILGIRLCGSQLPPVQRTTQNLMWIRFKTDNSGAYSGFQASYTTCGGSFTSSYGVLTSPSYPSTYPYSMDCTYVISQPSGYFVTLTFTVFSLQTSVSCSSDFLEIRDGIYSNSPLLGPRLCGTTIPATQRTTQNYMIIRFKSDSSNNFNGFRAEFSTCGGYFSSPYGTIESPSYPGNYANNLDCFYLISQTAGYFVGLTFTDFYLEAGSGCADDFIEVREGSTQSSPQISSSFCGSTIPPFLKSSQGSMSIRFRSNGSGVYRGFQASYTTCGGRFTSSSGVLTSPSYPSNYPNNMDCTYVISQSSGYFITLTFTIFYLQSSVNCSSDFLEIRNGGYLTSPLLGPRLCGTTTPPTQTTTQNFMFIHFKSDSSNNYNGFQAVFSECGGYFNAQYGTMHSPSYPSNYANNLDCIYVISQAAGYFVSLTFTDFYLEGGTGCPYDYIEIRDGNTQSSSQIGSRICGSTIPPFLKSSQGSMSIRFRSNWSGVYRGFQASYTTCGGIFTSAQGYIQSPSYPYSYSSNMDCVYIIRMPTAGYRITLSFRSFSLQGGSSCLNDSLEIRDGGLQTSPLLGQTLCGTTIPPTQTTSQHLAWIHFKSDNSLNYQGFQLFYTTSCTESYSLKQGVIQSPSFPSNYPDNIDCAYVISQQPGYYIRLNFTDFMLQNGSGCLDDFVEVRDGGYSTSPLIGNRFCGSSIPPTLKSTQNIMSIRLKTNNALSYRGFRALYDVACGSVFTAQRSSISSPSTAVSTYLSGQECVYVIAQPQMYRVTLNFTRFYLTFGMNCTSDYVEILDGESPYSPILGSRFCGVTLPPVQRSTQNTLSIRFKIELSSSNKGFQVFYTAEVIPQEIILVTDDVSVIHMDLETRSYSHISTTSMQQPMGVDYDPVEDRVYWTDIARGEICSSRLNNTDFRMMHFLGKISKPYGIAVDTVSRLIFYTEAINNTIGLLTISNLSHKLLVSTDLDEPRAITLDKMNGLMFWSQVGRTPKIERANYDASDRKTLVATSIKYPSAIALDTDNNQLFWADSGTDLIECTDFEGRNRRLIYLSPDRHFVGMTLLGNHLYLTDWGQLGSNTTSSYIRRIDKDGHNEIIFATFAGHLHTVHIYSERSQHPGSSSCARNNGNCSHICIPAPNNVTKCMCPGVESLSVDRKECFSGWIIETDSSADRIIVIVASCGVLILIIITSIIVVVVIKRKKGQRSPNQSRHPQPTITRNPTYDGLNQDTRNTSCADRESSLYATIEDYRPETQNIDNPTYMSDENTYANEVLPEPNYENWGTSA